MYNHNSSDTDRNAKKESGTNLTSSIPGYRTFATATKEVAPTAALSLGLKQSLLRTQESQSTKLEGPISSTFWPVPLPQPWWVLQRWHCSPSTIRGWAVERYPCRFPSIHQNGLKFAMRKKQTALELAQRPNEWNQQRRSTQRTFG